MKKIGKLGPHSSIGQASYISSPPVAVHYPALPRSLRCPCGCSRRSENDIVRVSVLLDGTTCTTTASLDLRRTISDVICLSTPFESYWAEYVRSSGPECFLAYSIGEILDREESSSQRALRITYQEESQNCSTKIFVSGRMYRKGSDSRRIQQSGDTLAEEV